MSILRFVLAIFIILPCFNHISAQELYKGKPVVKTDWHGSVVECVSGELIVKLAPSLDKSALDEELSTIGLTLVQGPERRGFARMEAPEGADVIQLIDQAGEAESIEYAEPNFIHRLCIIPNDEYFPLQWSLLNTGYNPSGGVVDADMDCPEAWNQSTGENSVLVGVLDTGIPLVDGELSHPDLNDPSRFLLGYNAQLPGNPPTDDNGHGTHVTGTIAAMSDNSTGITGINWNCRILAVKVFSSGGSCSTYDLYDGIINAVDAGCQILNYSGGGPASDVMESGIAYADSNDVLFCASAGNEYHNSVRWPAAYSLEYDNLICVASSDYQDSSSCFSSIGPEVTVAAPGGSCDEIEANIYSTMPNYEVYLNTSRNYPQDYAYLRGTSMACPHVAGLAALILGMNPSLKPDSLRRIIENTADDLGDPGFDNYFGHGRINAYNALMTLGPLNIGHTPLENTKNYTSDYRIDCAIYSKSMLWADSLYMRYKIGATWTRVPLQLAKTVDGYYAYIPFQEPGTYIDYYIYARDYAGNRDSTPVYTFKVIDYQLILDPDTYTYGENPANDYTMFNFTVTNDGLFNDRYFLNVSENTWDAMITDPSGFMPLTQTWLMSPGMTYEFALRVSVPSTVNGDRDSALVTVCSEASPSQCESTRCVTKSLGQPLIVPMLDDFDAGIVVEANWIYNYGTDVSSLGINEPSAPYALHFDGEPSGSDTLVSQLFELQGSSDLNLQYAYQQTGSGDSPDPGDDLFLEYIDEFGEWHLLKQHLGSDPDMLSFEMVSIPLPAGAYHDLFRIRFRNIADEGIHDDWLIDNLELTYSPQANVTAPYPLTATLSPGEMTSMPLYIDNSGTGFLTYNVDIQSILKSTDPFIEILEEGKVEPATREYTEEFLDAAPAKGEEDIRAGYDVTCKSGGPDNYGYYWMTSSETGGPEYNWVDISATGTAIEGLADDNYVGPFPIGFEFPFYGNTYTEFYVSSNGYIGFGPPDNYGSLTKMPFPTPDIPNNIIALLWDDLNFADPNNPGAQAFYESAPNQLVIQFNNVPEYHAEVGDVFTGEIILRYDGALKLQYNTIGYGFDTRNCAVGIEDDFGLDGLEIVYLSSFLVKSFCIGIYPPGGNNWLSVAPSSGYVDQGDGDTLTVFLNTEGVQPGSYDAVLTVNTSDPDLAEMIWNFEAWLTVSQPFVVGDANTDGGLTVGDAVYLVNYIFRKGEPPVPYEAGDTDCSGSVDLSDVVRMVNFIFIPGSPSPCADLYTAPDSNTEGNGEVSE